MRTLGTIAISVFLFFMLAACKKPPAPSSAPDAAPAPKATAAKDERLADARRPVDLIYTVETVVAVSSRVANPRDFPEHLVDRKKDTAWNSKTGDLVGGWIGVRLPKTSYVDRFELTVGYDATSKDGTDLFLANHRIKRVRVLLDGEPLGEHTLDPNERKAQPIKVEREGGDYKIEVLETVPGTKTEWKELVVSELYAMGMPGVGSPPITGAPRVYVGSFSPPKPTYKAYRDRIERWFSSPAAFCDEYKAAMKGVKAPLEKFFRSEYPWEYEITLSCASAKSNRFPVGGPVLGFEIVTFDDGWATDTVALVQTSKGWRLAPGIFIVSESHFDTGCPVNTVELALEKISAATGTTAPTFIVQTTTGYINNVLRLVHTCTVGADELFKCRSPSLINEVERDNSGGILPGPAKRWGPDDKYTVAPDGTVTVHSARKGPVYGMPGHNGAPGP